MKQETLSQTPERYRRLMAMAERCEATNLQGTKKGKHSINALLRKIADGDDIQLFYKNRPVSNKTIIDF